MKWEDDVKVYLNGGGWKNVRRLLSLRIWIELTNKAVNAI